MGRLKQLLLALLVVALGAGPGAPIVAWPSAADTACGDIPVVQKHHSDVDHVPTDTAEVDGSCCHSSTCGIGILNSTALTAQAVVLSVYADDSESMRRLRPADLPFEPPRSA